MERSIPDASQELEVNPLDQAINWVEEQGQDPVIKSFKLRLVN